MSKYIKIKCL